MCTSSYLNDANTETFIFILTNHITHHWFKARSPSKTALAGFFKEEYFVRGFSIAFKSYKQDKGRKMNSHIRRQRFYVVC